MVNAEHSLETDRGRREEPPQTSPELGGVIDPTGSRAVDAILVADCGSSFTRLSLLERVEGGYCFVGHAKVPTTSEPPWSDVGIGVRHAIEQITENTGRILLDDTNTLILPQMGGQGVDLFVATSSAGQPLRVVLSGLVSQVSLASLERAATGAYVQIVGLIARDVIESKDRSPQSMGSFATVSSQATPAAQASLFRAGLPIPDRASEPAVDGDAALSRDQSGATLSDEEKIAVIRQQHPDVVWVAGGTDGGSREPVRDLVETVALACTLVDGPPRPAMVYAGNADLRTEIVELIGEEVDLEVIDNVRPALEVENLATAETTFQSYYVRKKLQRVPGIGTLIGWSDTPLIPTAQALEYLVMYLERLYASGKGVLCADVGSATTTVAASFPSPPDSARSTAGSRSSLELVTDLGVGYGAATLLERVGLKSIVRWLPFEAEPGEVEAVLLNKAIRSTTIPQNRRELLIEQAAAREALRLVMDQARQSWQHSLFESGAWRTLTPPLEPIIATGGVLSQAPRPGQTALMLLDALAPIGITTLVLDRSGLAAALGTIAVTQPQAAVQALDAGAFLPIGTVVAPVGRARPGEVIMRVEITFNPEQQEEERAGSQLELEVKYGSLEVLPLRVGEKARMELKLRRGFSVGRVGRTIEVNGGVIGLIVDARGRPLRLPSNLELCRQYMQQWLWDMGA